MATAKKNNYIDQELEWLEGKAEGLRAYCDNNPESSLTDRMGYRETRGGGVMPFVIASIENQIKSIRETYKDYILIIDAIARLREKEDQKKLLVRGTDDLTPMEDGSITEE